MAFGFQRSCCSRRRFRARCPRAGEHGWIIFPSVQALAQAPVADVLEEWQGMGYNRRALALKGAAEAIVAEYDGEIPQNTPPAFRVSRYRSSDGAGHWSFAFDLPGVYLKDQREDRLPTSFSFPIAPCPITKLVPLIQRGMPRRRGCGGRFVCHRSKMRTIRRDPGITRFWTTVRNLQNTVPNPSRRSSSYTRQSAFEGSRRQKCSLVRNAA